VSPSHRRPSRPTFSRSPAALVETFQHAVGGMTGVTTRQMFGYPAAFVGGRMFAGLFQNSLVLKLAAEDRAELSRRGATAFEPMPSRPMGEFVVAPATLVAKPGELVPWLARAEAYVRTLGPKAKRTRKP